MTGRGGLRTLHYSIRRRPDQLVRFFDVSEGKSAKEIGHVTSGGTGSFKFAPPGKTRRTIDAQFSLDGMPAERKTVTTFGPPVVTLPTPRRLRVVRAKKTGKTTVTWRGVAGARRYELAITSPKGYQRFVTTRKRRVVLKLSKSLSGRITIRAADTYRVSRVAARPFKRLAAPTSRFRKAKRCTVGKKKVICR